MFDSIQIFLTRATDLAEGLLPAFNSKVKPRRCSRRALWTAPTAAVKLTRVAAGQSGIPFSDVNLHSGKTHPPSGSRDSSTSEVKTRY